MALPNTNPFNWGKLPLGEDFADHKELLKELILDTLSGQNLILYGPRRIGKTSLIYEIFSQLRANYNYQTVVIDLFENPTIERITGKIFRELAGNVSKASTLARKVIKGISIKTIGDALELSSPPPTDLLIQTLNLIQSESEQGKKIIIAFDEFQELEKIDADLIKILRSQIQLHRFITYIFTGSNQRLINMFIDQDQPFYKFGKVIFLNKPDFNEIVEFLRLKFEKANLAISNENIRLLITKSKNFPYFTILLAQELWIECQLKNLQTIQEDTINSVITRIIQSYSKIYEEYWSKFTNNQRTALIIIANNELLYKHSTLTKYKIALSTIQRSVESLLKQQFLWKQDEKIENLDPFFELWIIQINN